MESTLASDKATFSDFSEVDLQGLPDVFPAADGYAAPRAPSSAAQVGIDHQQLRQLAVKLAYGTYAFSTEWAADQLRLSDSIVEEVLQDLVKDALLQTLGESGAFGHRYSITGRGADEAKRCLEICGYVGPAPVSLEAYSAFLQWQVARFPRIQPQEAAAAMAALVLPEEAVRVVSLAVSSGRSLFLYGPAGNGKTTLGRAIHSALRGDLWIPHCISVGESVIRVFDPLCHKRASVLADSMKGVDGRWIRIRRPLVVVGGELTMDALDLAFSQSLRFYEAPLHVKSNGGMLLIDDFGRQRIGPHELLNRWIVPLEYGIEHLALKTGQQIQVPFRQFLVFATNLDLSQVTDAAFLRRIGYRIELPNPTQERYAEILRRYAAARGVVPPDGVLDRVLDRYASSGVELRSCHPRDLIDRALDVCRFQGGQVRLTPENLDLAWDGYFGK